MDTHWPRLLLSGLLLSAALAPPALVQEDDDDDDPGGPEVCTEPLVEIAGSIYLNGLPLVQQDLELVGDAVQVTVEKPPYCHTATLLGLPYRWRVSGPTGAVTLTGGDTLRPHFHPALLGTYRAVLTYCPQTCSNWPVGGTLRVDVPPRSVELTFAVASELPVPPATEPVPTRFASDYPTIQWVALDNEERRRKCGLPGIAADWFTPQLVPTRPWTDQQNYQLVEGLVVGSRIAGHDNELNHSSHDAIVEVQPDGRYGMHKVPRTEDGHVKRDMEIEWESRSFPGPMRPLPGDRISAWGFHTYDCHHNDPTFGILAEIHPAVLTAVHRKRPIQIPNGWQGLGDNIHVPGIVTDIWANRRAGEMTSNCSTTGLHQQAQVIDGPYVIPGACIHAPHPFGRPFTFNIYLPPDPRQRLASVGVDAPPAPLYVNVESGGGLVSAVPDAQNGVTFVAVTVDLTSYTAETFSARVVAGWVQPSTDNWGLQRWKVGIDALDIFNDHDWAWGDDGDWVFWAAINNRDQEWTRLLDGGAVTGFHDFGGRPFETESPWADRNLGPHVQVFHPRFGDFPGLPLADLNRSLLIHTSGYDAEVADDPTGIVNHVFNLGAWDTPIGVRRDLLMVSNTGDYFLHYFVERVGPVTPSLSAAGRALASAYSLHPQGTGCARGTTAACLVLSEPLTASRAWHPLQRRLDGGGVPGTDEWRDSPSFEPQEVEESSFDRIPLAEVGTSLAAARPQDPARVERFFVELRQQYDAVRGTRLEAEYAKSLPGLETHLAPDLWQRHFGDIDPTPVDLAVSTVRIAPAAPVAGEEMTVSARVVNGGSGASVRFSVQLQLDGAAVRTVVVPTLPPGGSTTVNFPAWPAPGGSHLLRVTADALRQIAEPNEGDNVAEQRLVVAERR